MLLSFSHQSKYCPTEVQATPEKVREILELLGIGFYDFEKYKTHRNSRDRRKFATPFVY